MTSESLRKKIDKARTNALAELPQIRLCANVVLAATESDDALAKAVQQLKQGVGNNWSLVTALQLMSGRRGEFAADAAPPEERAHLHLVHQIAKAICTNDKFGSAVHTGGVDVARLKALVSAARSRAS